MIQHIEQIIGHCRSSYPKEACGILAGKRGVVEKVYFMANVSDDPMHCYFMDPKEQLNVFKEMRNEGLELLGIYHSHAYTDTYPSKRDIELAYYPEASYVIVSFKDIDNPVVRSFKIVEGRIEEEGLDGLFSSRDKS